MTTPCASLHHGAVLQRTCPPLTQEAFDDFGALLGTDAPIHVDPAYARATPWGGTIAQGMLISAPVEAWLCELLGEAAWFARGRLEVRLVDPARVGETVGMTLTVVAHDARSSDFEFSLHSAGRLLATGTAGLVAADGEGA